MKPLFCSLQLVTAMREFFSRVFLPQLDPKGGFGFRMQAQEMRAITITNLASEIIITNCSMEIAELLTEALAITSKHRNQMPLLHISGAPILRGPDVPTFLYRYKSLTAFTSINVTESNIITMLPYYCAEEIREKYWISVKILAAEVLVMFEFLASAVALPKTSTAPTSQPTSPALTTSPALPSSTSIPSSTSSAFMTPTTLTAPMALTTPTPTDITSLMNLVIPTAPTVEPTASLSPPPSAAPMASAALTAPTDSTNPMFLMAFMTPAIPMAPTVSPTPTTTQALADSTAPIAPMAPPAVITSPAPKASTACAPLARTHMARQGTIRIEPTVQLGIIRIEPPQGQKIRRYCYTQPEPVRPHRSDPTATAQSEPAPWNRQMPAQPPQKSEPAPPEPVQPRGQEPAPPNRQEVIQPPPYQEPVQLPKQVDRPPCYYCTDDQHNLQKCTDLSTDLGKGIVSINNRDRLVLGTAGAEIPMVPAAHDFCTIRDYARAGAPILTPSPAPQARLPPPPPPPLPAQS
ncbi:hypothetical protein K440DRAFT_679160 [Wilcoxina mikolae CBS 423.85]|nr:hypothetical protein K440DRAFT_679160 [Wilcoxina mikolae CBS 423.85]